MSTIFNSTIKKLSADADALRVELAEVEAGIAALVKIQGGAVAAIRRTPKGTKTNGKDLVPGTAASNDALLKNFTSPN